jgi:hypothetical protein
MQSRVHLLPVDSEAHLGIHVHRVTPQTRKQCKAVSSSATSTRRCTWGYPFAESLSDSKSNAGPKYTFAESILRLKKSNAEPKYTFAEAILRLE